MSIEHIVPSELEKCSKDKEDIHVKGIQEPKLKEYPMAKMGIIWATKYVVLSYNPNTK